MSGFFRPYEGGRPFFFVSYAHRQSEAVVSTIRVLHDRGWRLWYDEGIPAGSDWPANIARHMQSCERVVFFLSERALESSNCYSEMRTAFRLGEPILTVRLEEAELTPEWREILDGRPEIPLLDTAEQRAEAILHSGFLPRRLRRSWTEKIPWKAFGLTVSLLLFLFAAGTVGLLATGRWVPFPPPQPAPVLPTETPAPSPVPTALPIVELGEAERFFAVRFPDSQQERAIRRALSHPADEIYRWQVAEIRELYFCGNMITDSLDRVGFDPDGTCRVNGAPVVTGKVTDLTLLESAASLETLALICQPLRNIASLNGHVRLRELSLAGSSVDSLSVLWDLPALETLHLEHTAVRDLTPLEALPALRTVTVSREMLPLEWNETAAFAVVLTE